MPDIDQSQLVTLDQIAAMVRLTKRSLKRHVRKMPAPYRRGRCGRAALWLWSDVVPWLVEIFEMPRLPERFPTEPPRALRDTSG